MAEMKPDKNVREKISCDDWNFNAEEVMQKLMRECLQEVLCSEHFSPDIFLQSAGYPQEDDNKPLELELTLPFSTDDTDRPSWRVPFSELVEQLPELVNGREHLVAILDALQTQINELRKECDPAKWAG